MDAAASTPSLVKALALPWEDKSMVFSTHARIGVSALAVALTLSLAACGLTEVPGARPDRGTTVTIGAKNSHESVIIAQIYGQALELDGFDVDYNLGIGNRKAQLAALKSGLIDVIPEYSGALMNHLDKNSALTSTDSMVARLPALLKKRKLEILDPSPAAGNPAFVVTKEFAQTHALVTIADLTSIESTLTIGAESGFEEQSYGRSGLDLVYGFSGWVYREFDEGNDRELVDALVAGEIDIANVPQSSPDIANGELVVLSDPAVIITEQNVIPVVRSKINSEAFAAVINEVSAELTTKDLRELLASNRGKTALSAETLAREWLEEHNFDE